MDEFMKIAIDEAKSAQAEGNYPYGSILARGREIIGRGRNYVNTHNDPTSHAEIEAIRAAGCRQLMQVPLCTPVRSPASCARDPL